MEAEGAMHRDESKMRGVVDNSTGPAQGTTGTHGKPDRISPVGRPLERVSIVGLPLERISILGFPIERITPKPGKPVRVGIEEFRVRGIEPVHGGNYYAEVRCLTCGTQWEPRRKRGRLASRWWVCPAKGCNKGVQ